MTSDSSSEMLDKSLIPDYVINYLRGETPETIAKRKRNRGRLGERDVDVAHQHRPHQSRAAEFEGFSEVIQSRSGWSGAENAHLIDRPTEKANRGWRRLLGGWRGGVALHVLLSFLIWLVSFICLILLTLQTSLFTGEGAIYSGSCSTANSINWAVHAVINIFIVILIAGGNYVFQVLSSPTRSEVIVAHDKKKWLDIGVPSLRNLPHIARIRVFLAMVIVASAIITQVM
jgi:hypothetical protein